MMKPVMACILAALAGLVLAGCNSPGTVHNGTTVTMAPPPSAETIPSINPDDLLPAGFTTDAVAPVVNNGQRTANNVALTFDADMTPSMATHLHTTPGASYANTKVIDILEERHIPATFFITGMWVDEYPQLMSRIAANSDFDIGNHTWTHPHVTSNCYGLPTMTPAELTAEVTQTFAKIRPYGGHQTNYFRFPGLCHNDAALQALASNHVTVIDGDVISGDPGATSAAPIVNAVLSRVRPGSIVVLHITKDNARYTDAALPQILDGLAVQGLHPVRLSVLLGQSH